MSGSVVLAIESSCDETAVALLRGTSDLLASEVSSQAAVHAEFGGVVPEVASRRHLANLPGVIDVAVTKAGVTLDDVDVFAATVGPGLPAALLIGSAAAKGLAIGLRRPFFGMNHIEGHLLSPFFGLETVEPHVAMVVSGGHTLLFDVAGVEDYRVLGGTLDDAAGEAFDKVGKLLGLPYPGGVEIDRLARNGDPARYDFPRSMLHSGNFQFSFSGLKTAVRHFLEKEEGKLEDICASFQEAVVDVLVQKAMSACAACGKAELGVSGGVSSNTRLRERLEAESMERGVQLRVAESWLRTDNAAMIAYAAAQHSARGAGASPLDLDVQPNFDVVLFEQPPSIKRPIETIKTP
jgi:N6-L-threonylcarbamoyladenine synthase